MLQIYDKVEQSLLTCQLHEPPNYNPFNIGATFIVTNSKTHNRSKPIKFMNLKINQNLEWSRHPRIRLTMSINWKLLCHLPPTCLQYQLRVSQRNPCHVITQSQCLPLTLAKCHRPYPSLNYRPSPQKVWKSMWKKMRKWLWIPIRDTPHPTKVPNPKRSQEFNWVSFPKWEKCIGGQSTSAAEYTWGPMRAVSLRWGGRLTWLKCWPTMRLLGKPWLALN